MKRRFVLLLSSICVLSMTGCGISSFSGTKVAAEENTVPSDALVAIEDTQISLDTGNIKIPDGYTIGSGEFTDSTSSSTSSNKFTLYGIWKTEDDDSNETEDTTESTDVEIAATEEMTDYKQVTDNDLIFYVMFGEDNNSPDRELSKSEVNTSLKAYNSYLSSLLSFNYPSIDDITLNDSEGQPIVDEQGNISARTSKDGNWYYTTFTATSGEKVITTYSTICYPKTYYGIMMLGTDQNPDYSRKYFIFVFSNDSNGEILAEDEYNSLFNQIKTLYSLDGFYTTVQLSAEKDDSTNYYNGRSYAQFDDLMQDTYNYFILKGNSETEDEQLDISND